MVADGTINKFQAKQIIQEIKCKRKRILDNAVEQFSLEEILYELVQNDRWV